MPNPPIPVGMTLQQQSQKPRSPTLPFNGQDLPNQMVSELLKEAADSATAAQTSERNVGTLLQNTGFNTVAADIDKITTVSDNIGYVEAVGTNIGAVTDVAANWPNINVVAGDLSNVNLVAGGIANVDAVGPHINDVVVASSNIAAIQNAPAAASAASTSETNAYDSEIAAATAALQTAMYLVAPMSLTEPLGRADAIARSVPTFMVQGDGTTVAAYEYRVIDANTPSTLIAQYAPSTSLGTEVEDTAANIASAGSTLNITNKFKGKKVWDLTNKRLMRASGSTSTSPWDSVGGGTSVIPV